MIKIIYIDTRVSDRMYSCDDCNREIIVGAKYIFEDEKHKNIRHIEHLCEDCSNGMSNLHYKAMITNKDHTLRDREITEDEVTDGV